MQISKENKFLLSFLGIALVDMMFLLISQFIKEWYEGGNGDCSWKGDSTKVYSSKCFTHKDYADSHCEGCSCCSSEDSIHKLGHSILPLIIIMIFDGFWVGNIVLCLLRDMDYDGYYLKICKILNIPAAFLVIIVFSVESFGLTDETLKAGMGLRITSVVFFMGLCILLFSLNNSLKGKLTTSLFRENVTALPLVSGNDTGNLAIVPEKTRKQNPIVINGENSFTDEL